jgi:hypothetical protein
MLFHHSALELQLTCLACHQVSLAHIKALFEYISISQLQLQQPIRLEIRLTGSTALFHTTFSMPRADEN